jgi:hypothetical protein
MIIETRDVLAGAYMARKPLSLLSHAVIVDEQGLAVQVLCGRVNLDSLADRYASDPAAPPTCKICQRRKAAMVTAEDEPIVNMLETRARLVRLEASHLEQVARTWRTRGKLSAHDDSLVRRRIDNIRNYADQIAVAMYGAEPKS